MNRSPDSDAPSAEAVMKSIFEQLYADSWLKAVRRLVVAALHLGDGGTAADLVRCAGALARLERLSSSRHAPPLWLLGREERALYWVALRYVAAREVLDDPGISCHQDANSDRRLQELVELAGVVRARYSRTLQDCQEACGQTDLPAPSPGG
jgi:hypothetical protein